MPRVKKKQEKIEIGIVEKILGQPSPYENVTIIGGLILFMLLIYTIQSLLSPFLIIFSIIFLLYPLRTYPVAKNIMLLAGLLFIFWFFRAVEGILAPFILSLFLAYLLHPIVTKIERWGIPRWTSALFIILCIVALLIILVLVALPRVISQFEGILQAIGFMSSQFTHWLFEGRLIKVLQKYGVSTSQMQQIITNTVAPRVEDVVKNMMQIIFNLLGSVSLVVSGIVNLIILPFITFYMLKDFPLVKYRLKMLVPRKRRDEATSIYNQIDDVVGRYIRGTTIIGIFDACAVITGFSILSVQYALILGILSGILFFIPYFGFITMMITAAVVTTLSGEASATQVFTVLGYLVALHIVENFILSPRIIGKKVGLHPIVLLLSIFLFGYLFGFIGLLIAIPAAGSIIVVVKDWELNRKKTLKLEDNGSTVETNT